ncbi:protein FAM234B-like [Watersipora subatra]|uniref:protein FAM234B-like n=1 Tax=Watersipora subatra TaxID=2589382 RepID=UPI00355B5F32
MSVLYSAQRKDEASDGEVELDGLLQRCAAPSDRIDLYIPARKRTVLFDIGVLVSVLVAFIITVALVVFFLTRPSQTTPKITGAKGWMNTYQHIGSESVVRLIDVNGDGCDDAIFGVAQLTNAGLFIHQAPYCRKYRQGCRASILAVDGLTGEELWNISTYSEIFELNCGNIDINRDGRMDCLGAGRKGSYVAFSPHSGQLLWPAQTGHEPYIAYDWNIYNPLVTNDMTRDVLLVVIDDITNSPLLTVIDDITKDGIKEVFLPHGGDPEFPPDNTTRYPGRLLLLDGATGELIGKYIETPDGRETYNSPVLHKDKGGTQYVIMGTGGETVNGGLFIARLTDLVTQIRSELFNRSKSKGVMVPVVLADLNHDRCADIIMSSFDGILAAYDGDSFNKLWQFEDRAGESYTTPGVGHFNGDKYPDLMMHWNYGVWPNYNRSVAMIHSGKDGRVIWMFNTTRFSMTSDLVIQTERLYQDMFVFRVQGRSGEPVDKGVGVVHGVDPQRNLQMDKGKGATCDKTDQDIFASEVFLVDWTTRTSPRRAFRRDIDKYYYDPVKEAKGTYRKGKHKEVGESKEKKLKQCVIMEQSSRTTGAIGDVNNDGKLDLVLTFNAQGLVNDIDGNYLRDEPRLDLVAVELEANIEAYPALKDMKDIVEASDVFPVHLKSRDSQMWTGYMGADSCSLYRGSS